MRRLQLFVLHGGEVGGWGRGGGVEPPPGRTQLRASHRRSFGGDGRIIFMAAAVTCCELVINLIYLYIFSI